MRKATGVFDANGREIFEGDIVQRWSNGYLIGSGVVRWGVYNFSHCDEYSCEHYGWYIDFVVGGYMRTNTGYPLWIQSRYKDYEKNEIIGNELDDLASRDGVI